ncbi:MAG: nicotinamidase [Methanocella sp.]
MNKNITLNGNDALLVTDIQNDFLPGGALPVTDGDKIIPAINNYIERFEAAKAHVIASRDWHPPNHISFKSQGGPWPPHCIQETEGAKFSTKLKLPDHIVVISKATDPKHEAYSAFDNTNLNNELDRLGIKRLFVAGLATDYCVVNTVLDARKLGYDTFVLMDATLGINVNPGDVDRAVKAMTESGARLVTIADFAEPEDKLPITEATPDAFAEKPSMLADAKKKAKMRSKGVNKRLKTERRG